jgi:hypothetical protein
MAKISKYVKLDKDVLMEYIYDDGNVISDRYKLLTDSRNSKVSYIADDTSSTGNIQANQLINLDLIESKYGRVDQTLYSYVMLSNYPAAPLRHDTLRFHIPINWTFGEYLGFYIKVYTFDSSNTLTYNLSNFYFDITDISKQNLMEYNSPPLLFHQKLWGKSVSIEIPSVSQISAQIANDVPRPNSLNSNISGVFGINSSSPIMIDFFFIEGIKTINGVSTYTIGQKLTTSVPQSPEFESLGLMIENSPNGDFFEIYGTYNGNITEFNKFIQDSVRMGNKYYVEYSITTYEQNVRGKTMIITVTDNFNETIEFRPIIKRSTTTAIIDVEMRLIDNVDESSIIRRASYGMLQDEVSKYGSNMSKINISNALKPKIYNIKNNIDPSLLGKTNALGVPLGTRGRTGRGFNLGIATKKGDPVGNLLNPNQGNLIGGGALQGAGGGLNGAGSVQTVKVPYAVLVDKTNVIAKSDNQMVNNKLYYGIGKMQVFIYPFDNVLKFTIATGDDTSQKLMDMTGLGEIKLVFKNDTTSIDFGLMQESEELNVAQGQVVFKISEAKVPNIKTIYNSGVNLFYITATNGTNNTVVYTGLFKIYDNVTNISDLNKSSAAPKINQDPNLPKETAVVTMKKVSSGTEPAKKPTS